MTFAKKPHPEDCIARHSACISFWKIRDRPAAARSGESSTSGSVKGFRGDGTVMSRDTVLLDTGVCGSVKAHTTAQYEE